MYCVFVAILIIVNVHFMYFQAIYLAFSTFSLMFYISLGVFLFVYIFILALFVHCHFFLLLSALPSNTNEDVTIIKAVIHNHVIHIFFVKFKIRHASTMRSTVMRCCVDSVCELKHQDILLDTHLRLYPVCKHVHDEAVLCYRDEMGSQTSHLCVI